MPSIHLAIAECHLPPGRFLLAASARGVCRVVFPSEPRAAFERWLARHYPNHERADHAGQLDGAIAQLSAYFAGELTVFELPLDLRATGFQRAVLERVARIPFGQTTSYGALAHALGRPKAARAVGAANGANPLPVIVPCHRVVGANGRLTGFGGGLPLKVRLLELEGHRVEDGCLVGPGQRTLFGA